MTKISIRFLVGFVAVAAAGAAVAQSSDMPSMSNSLSSQLSSQGSAVASQKLSAQTSNLAMPSGSDSLSGMMSSLKSSGVDMPIANVKLGSGVGAGSMAAPSNPFSDMAKGANVANFANSLQSGGSANVMSESQAVAFIGIGGTSNQIGALAAQAISTQKLGK